MTLFSYWALPLPLPCPNLFRETLLFSNAGSEKRSGTIPFFSDAAKSCKICLFHLFCISRRIQSRLFSKRSTTTSTLKSIVKSWIWRPDSRKHRSLVWVSFRIYRSFWWFFPRTCRLFDREELDLKKIESYVQVSFVGFHSYMQVFSVGLSSYI